MKTRTVFGKALRDARKKARRTQVELASALGVTQATICKAETGAAHVLSPQDTRLAASFLGVDPWPLLRARRLSDKRFELPNLSEKHAEIAVLLMDKWTEADEDLLRRLRTALEA